EAVPAILLQQPPSQDPSEILSVLRLDSQLSLDCVEYYLLERNLFIQGRTLAFFTGDKLATAFFSRGSPGSASGKDRRPQGLADLDDETGLERRGAGEALDSESGLL